MIVKLQILAKDILETGYFEADDCPITRALKRAGIFHIKSIGLVMENTKTGEQLMNSSHDTLNHIIVRMYNTKHNDKYSTKVPIEDFEFELSLN